MAADITLEPTTASGPSVSRGRCGQGHGRYPGGSSSAVSCSWSPRRAWTGRSRWDFARPANECLTHTHLAGPGMAYGRRLSVPQAVSETIVRISAASLTVCSFPDWRNIHGTLLGDLHGSPCRRDKGISGKSRSIRRSGSFKGYPGDCRKARNENLRLLGTGARQRAPL